MSSSVVSMTDAAYQFLAKRKKEVEFAKLWAEVAKVIKLPENQLGRKKAEFYSQLMLDGRFAPLKGNKWDLRDRRTFEETHMEVEEVDDDEDELLESENEEDELDLPKNDEEY